MCQNGTFVPPGPVPIYTSSEIASSPTHMYLQHLLCAFLAICPLLFVASAPQNERFNSTRFVHRKAALNPISRADVMNRAIQWTNQQIPYCQCNGQTECCGSCPYCSDYRCDCSGYVSYCWGLPYGYTTFTLPQVSHQISKDELLEGDILLYVQEHVVLFGGWADSENNTYHAYQEPGCHTDGPHYAYVSTVPYPMNWDPSSFVPYRYNYITGGGSSSDSSVVSASTGSQSSSGGSSSGGSSSGGSSSGGSSSGGSSSGGSSSGGSSSGGLGAQRMRRPRH